MSLKSRSYILDIVHVNLSLEIFFLSQLFNGELITPAFMIKNTQQKVVNLMFCLTLTAVIGSIKSCELYYNLFCRWFPNDAGLGKSKYANAMHSNVLIFKKRKQFCFINTYLPFFLSLGTRYYFLVIQKTFISYKDY